MGNSVTMVDVDSSNVGAIGYDDEQGELHVRFNSGSAYTYADVPKSVFEAFLNAPSKGRYLIGHIKGVYDYRRV